MKCEYQGCENDAEFLDESDSKICEDCMSSNDENKEIIV